MKKSTEKKIISFEFWWIITLIILVFVFIITFNFVVLNNSKIYTDSDGNVSDPGGFKLLSVTLLFAAMASCGMAGSLATNNKLPLTAFILSVIAVTYKLTYSIIAWIQGQEVNYTLYSSQIEGLIIVFIQLFLWKSWNKDSVTEKKFSTKKIATQMELVLFIALMAVILVHSTVKTININSKADNSPNVLWLYTMITVLGGLGYMGGKFSALNGLIWVFPLFFLSGISLMSSTGISMTSDIASPLLKMDAGIIFIQVTGYLTFNITGFFRWWGNF